MNLILFGFKGCGKTYFGQKLAEKVRAPFIDTDQLLSDILSPRQLHQSLGKEAFRAHEKSVVLSLKPSVPTIIATGGATVLDPDNVLHLKTLGRLVYLNAPLELLKRRLLSDLPSFLEAEDPIGSLAREYAKRASIYASIPAKQICLETLDEASVLTELCSVFLSDYK